MVSTSIVLVAATDNVSRSSSSECRDRSGLVGGLVLILVGICAIVERTDSTWRFILDGVSLWDLALVAVLREPRGLGLFLLLNLLLFELLAICE